MEADPPGAHDRLSKYWVFGYRPEGDDSETGLASAGVTVAFREWIDGRDFLNRLTDNLEPQVSIFARYKRLLEDEDASDYGRTEAIDDLD